MGMVDLIALVVAAAACLAAVFMAVVVARWRARIVGMRAECDRATMAEAATIRVLRGAVADLRADGMRLLGYAERLSPADESAEVAGIIATARQILAEIDDMQDYAVPSAASRHLELETLPLRPLIDDAIAAVTATLGPSNRYWRIAEEIDRYALLADRRALSHVLGRVLSNAARHSRHDDWIDVSMEHRGSGVALIIEDEGAGIGAPKRTKSPGLRENRGMGLGLVLARVLMEAHGGLLTVETAARVGTKITLSFPPNRVASPSDATIVRLAA